MRITVWLLASCALLSACGGDGGSSGSASVSSTGIVTSTPTPTSTAQTTGEIKPTAGAATLSATMELTTSAGTTNQTTGSTTGGTTSNRSTLNDTPSFALSYDAQTGYHLSDTKNAATFGPSEFKSETSGNFPTVSYSRIASPIEDYLALYKPLATTTNGQSFISKYAGTGGWQHTVVGATSRQTRLDYFAYGPATAALAMPNSGSAKFFSGGYGNYAEDTRLFFLNESGAVTVDFAAGTVFAVLGFSGSNFYADERGGVIGFRISGKIIGNSVEGPIDSDIAGFTGRFHLIFVGPNADEFILTCNGQIGAISLVSSIVGYRGPT